MMESQEGKPGSLLLPAAAQRPTTDTPGVSVPAVQLCTPLPPGLEVPRAARSPAGDSLGAVRPAGGALVAWIHALRLEKSGGS